MNEERRKLFKSHWLQLLKKEVLNIEPKKAYFCCYYCKKEIKDMKTRVCENCGKEI